MEYKYNIVKKQSIIKEYDKYYLFPCPYCSILTIVNKDELNCKIFRCGIIKETQHQINPHETKENCDYLFNNNKIMGCGKPYIFKFQFVEECDYI